MQIVLDGHRWKTEADFIEAILAGVEAPTWHGRNYNALRDSLVAGSINGVEPSYDFIIGMPYSPTPELADAVRYFIERTVEWRAEGARLSVRVEQAQSSSDPAPIPRPLQT